MPVEIRLPATRTSVRQLLRGAALALLLLSLNAGHVTARLGWLHKSKQVLETDQRAYLEMSWDWPWKARDVEAPFCWRPLAPLLAHGLFSAGVPMNAAWYLLTNLWLFAFLVSFHGYLERRGFGPWESALGLILVGLLPAAVRWYEYQYWMTDPPALCLVSLAFLLIERRRDRWLAPVGLVGVAARETWLLVLPYYVLRRLREEGPRAAIRKGCLVALPALALVAFLRYGLAPRPHEDLLGTVREALAFRARHLLDNQLYFATLGSFGVLLPLLLLFPARLASWARTRYEEAAVVAVVVGSLALAENTDRLLVYAIPVVVPAALMAFRELQARGGLGRVPAAVLVVALQLVFWQETRYAGLQGASLYQPTSWTVIALMSGFWALAWWQLRAPAAKT